MFINVKNVGRICMFYLFFCSSQFVLVLFLAVVLVLFFFVDSCSCCVYFIFFVFFLDFCWLLRLQENGEFWSIQFSVQPSDTNFVLRMCVCVCTDIGRLHTKWTCAMGFDFFLRAFYFPCFHGTTCVWCEVCCLCVCVFVGVIMWMLSSTFETYFALVLSAPCILSLCDYDLHF